MSKYFFRPSILIALSAAVVVGAAFVVFQGPPTQGRPTPLSVAAGQREIVWLYAATNATSWERFVTAVRQTVERLKGDQPGLQADYSKAYPQETTAVPEVALSLSRPGARFVFRWYKLTSDWKSRDWIEALVRRQPPPLAIIGGSSSDNAREIATHLNQLTEHLPAAERPLLLLTSATADRVTPLSESDNRTTNRMANAAGSRSPSAGDPAKGFKLTQLYPQRTFRFCFTNQQMATAVSNFIFTRSDLWPDKDPLYMAMWNDDSYSRDLIDGFWRALQQEVVRNVANQWVWPRSQFNGLANPWTLTAGIFPLRTMSMDVNDPDNWSTFYLNIPPTPHVIDSSVGDFATPNPYEAKASGEMLDSLMARAPRRPLLIVAGQSQPSRRFLRGLIRGAPSLSKHTQFVVATGDAISFNTVYRDRQVAWNIQDLPFSLVFFCHRNPIDAAAGFRAVTDESDEKNSTAATGTEDVLLFGDILAALVQAGAPANGKPCANAGELAERLTDIRLEGDRIVLGGDGIALFNKEGQRQSGTGEHVVCLQPLWDEDFKDRLLPRATIEVWAWRRRDLSRGERGQHWQRSGEPLNVSYSDTRLEGGDAHGRP